MEQEVLDAPITSSVEIYNPIAAGIALMLEKHGPHGDQVRLYPVGRLDYLSEGLLLMTLLRN